MARYYQSSREMNETIIEYIRGMKEIKVFGHERPGQEVISGYISSAIGTVFLCGVYWRIGLVAVARAMLKDAPIVILDEATASVDPDNEGKIQ